METNSCLCKCYNLLWRQEILQQSYIFENKEKITLGVLHGDRWPLHQKEAGETCDGGGDF